MARVVACLHSAHQIDMVAAGRQNELGRRLMLQLESHFAMDASAAYATRETAEQDARVALGNALDGHALGGQAPAEQAVVGDALGQQTDWVESFALEAAALTPAALGTCSPLGLV